MRKFVMAIGLPFSGKSTASEKYKKEGWDIIERDPLLEQILQDPEFEKLVEIEKQKAPGVFSFKKAEWLLRSSMAGDILGQKVADLANKSTKNVFYDGTNLKLETRLQVLTGLDPALIKEAMVFHIPLETVLERAKEAAQTGARQEGLHAHSLHEADLVRMAGWFEKPVLQEGFAVIHEYQMPTESSNEMKIKFK